MVSSQKGPTRHAYAWQIVPFWQDTLDMTDVATGELRPHLPTKINAIQQL